MLGNSVIFSLPDVSVFLTRLFCPEGWEKISEKFSAACELSCALAQSADHFGIQTALDHLSAAWECSESAT